MTSPPDQPRTDPCGTDAPDAGITETTEGLADLDALPVAEHVERFEAVHEALSAALASIDEV